MSLLLVQNADRKKAGRAVRREYPVVGVFKSIARILDRGRGPDKLAAWLGLRQDEVEAWAQGRPPEPSGREFYYNRFTIPKRDGRTREIDAPSDALKSMQRRVLHRLLNPLPAAAESTGFVRGRSVVHNAQPHTDQDVVINIDLENFFPSITAQQVRASLVACGWSNTSADILTNICTYQGRLPQGSPTSPPLSNMVARRLDARLAGLVKGYDGHYTRYADDMTFSFPAFGAALDWKASTAVKQARCKLLSMIQMIIEEEGFKIQRKKRIRIQRAHQRQTATGLVVNSRVNLPREFRRRIRAAEHREKLGKLSAEDKARLRGWQSWRAMVSHQGAQAASPP